MPEEKMIVYETGAATKGNEIFRIILTAVEPLIPPKISIHCRKIEFIRLKGSDSKLELNADMESNLGSIWQIRVTVVKGSLADSFFKANNLWEKNGSEKEREESGKIRILCKKCRGTGDDPDDHCSQGERPRECPVCQGKKFTLEEIKPGAFYGEEKPRE